MKNLIVLLLALLMTACAPMRPPSPPAPPQCVCPVLGVPGRVVQDCPCDPVEPPPPPACEHGDPIPITKGPVDDERIIGWTCPDAPAVVLDAWETQLSGNFLAGPPGYVFTNRNAHPHVFDYPTMNQSERAAYRAAVTAAGYNVMVMTYLEQDFGDRLDFAAELAVEIANEPLMVVAFLGNENDSFDDHLAWVQRIVPFIDGPNVILSPVWEPPDGETTRVDQVCCDDDGDLVDVDFNWRMDDALMERSFANLRDVGDRVAGEQMRRSSPRAGHGRPGWWSAGIGMRGNALTGPDRYAAGYEDRGWLVAMRDHGMDWWLMQEWPDACLSCPHEPGPGEEFDEANGVGPFFWFFHYAGAPGFNSRGHIRRICEQGVGVVLFEWSRDSEQFARAVLQIPGLVAAAPSVGRCYRGVM